MHEGLRLLLQSLQFRAERGRRALTLATRAFVEQIVLVEVPIFGSVAVFAHEFVAGHLQVVEPYENVRTEKPAHIVDDGSGAFMTAFCLKIYIERDQCLRGILGLSRDRWHK